MTRFFSAAAAIAMTAIPFIAVANSAMPPRVHIVTIDGGHHPILLKRMMVTATPLPPA